MVPSLLLCRFVAKEAFRVAKEVTGIQNCLQAHVWCSTIEMLQGTYLAHRDGMHSWAAVLQGEKCKLGYILGRHATEVVHNGIYTLLLLLLAHHKLL